MISVLILLLISIYVKLEFRKLTTENYNMNYAFARIVFNLALYQLCYWLIEKFDKLIQLRNKSIYLLGILVIMFVINGLLAIFFYRYLFLMGVPFIFLDSTFLAILIFIISTLIRNYLLNRTVLINKHTVLILFDIHLISLYYISNRYI